MKIPVKNKYTDLEKKYFEIYYNILNLYRFVKIIKY